MFPSDLLHDFPGGMSWALWTKQVLTPVIVAAGIVGNILSFIVMSSRPLRHKSYSFYLRALAVFDSLTLISREVLAVEEIQISYGRPSIYSNFGDASCKTMRFAESVSCLMSSWLVAFMAVERFVAIYFPLRKTFYCTRKRALVAIVCLFNALCCCQFYNLVMVEHARGHCTIKREYFMLYLNLYTYLYLLAMILLLPVLLIVFCNGMVVCKLFRYRQIPCNHAVDSESEKTAWVTQRRHKTTYMLITITSAYIVTVLPITLCSVIIQVTIESKPRTEAERIFMAFEPYKHLLEIWSALNYSVNFFIYIVSGKMFRRELKHVLTRRTSGNGSGVKTRSTHLKEEIQMT